MVMVVPFMGLEAKVQKEIDGMMPFIKLLKFFAPTYQMKLLRKPTWKPWIHNWIDDPIAEQYN